MNSIKKVPDHELYYNLRRLSEFAKAVAYAKNPADAEFFTMKYLRHQIEVFDIILNNKRNSNDNNS